MSPSAMTCHDDNRPVGRTGLRHPSTQIHKIYYHDSISTICLRVFHRICSVTSLERHYHGWQQHQQHKTIVTTFINDKTQLTNGSFLRQLKCSFCWFYFLLSGEGNIVRCLTSSFNQRSVSILRDISYVLGARPSIIKNMSSISLPC